MMWAPELVELTATRVKLVDDLTAVEADPMMLSELPRALPDVQP